MQHHPLHGHHAWVVCPHQPQQHLRHRQHTHMVHQPVQVLRLALQERHALGLAPGQEAPHCLGEVARKHGVQGGVLVHEPEDLAEERAVVLDQGGEHRIDLAAEDFARKVRVLELALGVRVLPGHLHHVCHQLLHHRSRLQEVDEAAVERLALLDHVVLLQQVLQGEAVLVQDQLHWRGLHQAGGPPEHDGGRRLSRAVHDQRARRSPCYTR
mmetsp:Transcript_21755/g.53729  ORF Transcript_21755/g.53729 Transcript_21755/m.53729 type:complete len:212 (+) Transcript_21755:2270-2905(+)